jgi:hypothetical protein
LLYQSKVIALFTLFFFFFFFLSLTQYDALKVGCSSIELTMIEDFSSSMAVFVVVVR